MKVSPSRFAVNTAGIIALVASGGDALSVSPSYQFPDWVRFFMTLPGFAGAYCAPIASRALDLGHHASSAGWEFALSLPFNFALYWLLFRISAAVILFVFPAKHKAHEKTPASRSADEEFDRQT